MASYIITPQTKSEEAFISEMIKRLKLKAKVLVAKESDLEVFMDLQDAKAVEKEESVSWDSAVSHLNKKHGGK